MYSYIGALLSLFVVCSLHGCGDGGGNKTKPETTMPTTTTTTTTIKFPCVAMSPPLPRNNSNSSNSSNISRNGSLPICAHANSSDSVQSQIHACSRWAVLCYSTDKLEFAKRIRNTSANRGHRLRLALGLANLTNDANVTLAKISQTMLRSVFNGTDGQNLREMVCGCPGGKPIACPTCNTMNVDFAKDACMLHSKTTDLLPLPGLEAMNFGYRFNGKNPVLQWQTSSAERPKGYGDQKTSNMMFRPLYADSPEYVVHDGDMRYVVPTNFMGNNPVVGWQDNYNSNVMIAASGSGLSSLSMQQSLYRTSLPSDPTHGVQNMTSRQMMQVLSKVPQLKKWAQTLPSGNKSINKTVFGKNFGAAVAAAMEHCQSQSFGQQQQTGSDVQFPILSANRFSSYYTAALDENYMTWKTFSPCLKRELAWAQVTGWQAPVVEAIMEKFGDFYLSEARVGAMLTVNGVAGVTLEKNSMNNLKKRMTRHLKSDAMGKELHISLKFRKLAEADAESQEKANQEMRSWESMSTDDLVNEEAGFETHAIGSVDANSARLFQYQSRPFYKLPFAALDYIDAEKAADVFKAFYVAKFVQAVNCSKATMGKNWADAGVCSWDGSVWKPGTGICNDTYAWDSSRGRCEKTCSLERFSPQLPSHVKVLQTPLPKGRQNVSVSLQDVLGTDHLDIVRISAGLGNNMKSGSPIDVSVRENHAAVEFVYDEINKSAVARSFCHRGDWTEWFPDSSKVRAVVPKAREIFPCNEHMCEFDEKKTCIKDHCTHGLTTYGESIGNCSLWAGTDTYDGESFAGKGFSGIDTKCTVCPAPPPPPVYPTRWLCGDQGDQMECGDSSFVVGACHSGSGANCPHDKNCGIGTYAAVACSGEMSNKGSTQWYYGDAGDQISCKDKTGSVATGLCGSGAHPHCQNGYFGIDCSENDQKLGYDCVWSGSKKGSYAECPSYRPLMAGICSGGKNASCKVSGSNVKYDFAIQCCSVIGTTTTTTPGMCDHVRGMQFLLV